MGSMHSFKGTDLGAPLLGSTDNSVHVPQGNRALGRTASTYESLCGVDVFML